MHWSQWGHLYFKVTISSSWKDFQNTPLAHIFQVWKYTVITHFCFFSFFFPLFFHHALSQICKNYKKKTQQQQQLFPLILHSQTMYARTSPGPEKQP